MGDLQLRYLMDSSISGAVAKRQLHQKMILFNKDWILLQDQRKTQTHSARSVKVTTRNQVEKSEYILYHVYQTHTP